VLEDEAASAIFFWYSLGSKAPFNTLSSR
jgi:hypothetical protein